MAVVLGHRIPIREEEEEGREGLVQMATMVVVMAVLIIHQLEMVPMQLHIQEVEVVVTIVQQSVHTLMEVQELLS